LPQIRKAHIRRQPALVSWRRTIRTGPHPSHCQRSQRLGVGANLPGFRRPLGVRAPSNGSATSGVTEGGDHQGQAVGVRQYARSCVSRPPPGNRPAGCPARYPFRR